MGHASPLPGSSHHQTLLNAITALYENRDDVQALFVFGSLARGTWDDSSDIDLAVVIYDRVQTKLPVELARVRGIG